MRKKYISIILLIAIIVIIGLVPFVDGYTFKIQLTNLITAINQDTTYPIKIEIMDYQLGWLNSKAKLRLIPNKNNIDENAKQILPKEIIVENDISHGPFTYDKTVNSYVFAHAVMDTNIIMPEAWRAMLLNKNNPILIHTHFDFSFGGKVKEQTQISSLMIPGLGMLRFQDYISHFEIAVAQNKIQEINANGKLGAITLEGMTNNPSPIMKAIIQPSTYQITASRHGKELWDLKSASNLSGIMIQAIDGNSLTVNDINLSATKGYSGENFYNGSAQIKIKSITVPNTMIANISPFNLSFAFNNLNAQAVSDYLNYMKSRNLRMMTQEDTQNFANLVAKIITPTTNILMDVDMNSSLGDFVCHSKLFWQASLTIPATIGDGLAKTNAEMNIRIAAPLLQKVLESIFTKMEALMPMPSSGQINTANNMPAQANPASSPAMDNFRKQVAQFLQQGKMPLPVALQVLDLADQHLSVSEFTAKINPIVPQDIAKQLIQSYMTLQLANIKTTPVMQVQPQVSPADKAKQTIAGWVQQGLLIKNNNDYMTAITVRNSIVKVNSIAQN